ncbi:hypothetical protein EHS25_008245 [Saitozyma podzolica]|uniref:Uncharacterized protein n=1 Tax=Saitozyma podzolica TaxID=1890683 RepID=A0A427YP16_9TREE|nr:hypothetical protein EHS25_008245 [Saitozyma podzolica]
MFAIPSHERDTDLSSPRLDPTEDIWMAISRPGSNLAEYETFAQPTFSQYKRQLLDGLIDGITIHRRPSATTLGSLKAAGILPSVATRHLQRYLKSSRNHNHNHNDDRGDHIASVPYSAFDAAPIPDQLFRIFGGFTAVPNEVFTSSVETH